MQPEPFVVLAFVHHGDRSEARGEARRVANPLAELRSADRAASRSREHGITGSLARAMGRELVNHEAGERDRRLAGALR